MLYNSCEHSSQQKLPVDLLALHGEDIDIKKNSASNSSHQPHEKTYETRINGKISYAHCRLMPWFVRKLVLIAYSLLWAFFDIIIDMHEVLAENSTQLNKEVSNNPFLIRDNVMLFQLRLELSIKRFSSAKFNTELTWSKGNFWLKRVLCIVLWAETVRFGTIDGLFLWMWICLSCSQTLQLHKINWQSWVWPWQPLEKLPSSILRTPRVIWGRQTF